MQLPLENSCSEIIQKAQNGLNLNNRSLAEKAHVALDALVALKNETSTDENTIKAIAKALNLGPEALVASAHKSWKPSVDIPNGLASAQTDCAGMIVNAYIVWCPHTKHAACFDTGMEINELISIAQKHQLTIDALYLTHTHGDHIAAMDELKNTFPELVVYVNTKEALPDATLIKEGFHATLGKLSLKAFETSGHSSGGTTYFIEGLSSPIAIVGDSLFSGSMGKATATHYLEAIKNNKEKILTLPSSTILCPGHGPLTTVEQEKAHNPFFTN